LGVLGELIVQINGDESGLERSLNKATTSTGSAVDFLVKKVGLAAVAWKAVDLAIQGINYNKAAEQAEIAFGVFLGSASAAKDMIEELRDLAKETPLEFDEVRDAAKRLTAFGIEADKIVPTMRTLADVSAGLQIPIGDLAYLFGTIKTQGRAMTVDLMQFANRGIPIWKELEKITGKNETELRKFVEAGGVGFPQIETAFRNMTSEGGKFFNMAVKQMDSLAGSQSNLNDSFDVWLGHITSATTGPLKDWNRFWSDFFSGWVAFDKQFTPIANDIDTFFKNWSKSINPFMGMFESIRTDAAGLATEVKKVKLDSSGPGDFRNEIKAASKATEDAKKAAISLQAQYQDGQAKLAKATDEINAKIKFGLMTEKEGLEAKIKLRDKYGEDLVEMYLKEGGSLKFIQTETQRIVALNNDNKAVLGLIVQDESAIAMGKKLIADSQEAINQSTLDLLAYEESWFESDQSILDLRALMADETDVISQATLDALNSTEEWFKAEVKAEDMVSEIAKGLGTASKSFGSLATSARKFNNEGLAKVLDSLEEMAKDGEAFAESLVSVFASGGKDVGAWISLVVSGVALIGDAWNQVWGRQSNAQKEAREREREAERERLEAVKNLEAEYEAKFQTDLQRLEQERNERVAYARSIGADVLNIERYYAGEIAKVRTKSTGTQIESALIAAETKAIVDANEAQTASMRARVATLEILRAHGKASARAIFQAEYDALTAQLAAIDDATRRELESIETRLALFQDRYSQAFDGISEALTSALVDGTSEADFTQSIMDMLRKMAIDAAIVAGGFAEDFKNIGLMIAEALKDGFQEGEITTIKAAISSLYAGATSAITDINALFPGFASGTDFAPGGLAMVGEVGPELMYVPRGSQIIPTDQTRALLQSTSNSSYSKGDTVINIQSNAPLDPLETARQLQMVEESLAFAGAF
jgi:heme exporter protein D